MLSSALGTGQEGWERPRLLLYVTGGPMTGKPLAEEGSKCRSAQKPKFKHHVLLLTVVLCSQRRQDEGEDLEPF